MNFESLYLVTDGENTIDLRELSIDQLHAWSDDAATAGDLQTVAIIDTILAYEEPKFIGNEPTVEAIRSRVGDECDEALAIAFIDVLADRGHLHHGWLVITDQHWDDLLSDVAETLWETRETLPYSTPAFDGNDPAVFISLPEWVSNGPDVQSVPMNIAQAQAFAAQLIRDIDAARRMAQ